MKLYAYPDGVPDVMNFSGILTFTKTVKLRRPKGTKEVHDMESRILKEIRSISMRPEQSASYSRLPIASDDSKRGSRWPQIGDEPMRGPPPASHCALPPQLCGEKAGTSAVQSTIVATPAVGGGAAVGTAPAIESKQATLSKLEELEKTMMAARGVCGGTGDGGTASKLKPKRERRQAKRKPLRPQL